MLKLPKFSKPTMPKVRRRHVKKALMIIAYTFIAFVMVAGAIAPALQL